MRYFFPITAGLVAQLTEPTDTEINAKPFATSATLLQPSASRPSADAKRSNVANVATPPVTNSGWREYFEERAAIAEYESCLSRADAEAQAFEHLVVMWMADNPPPDPGGYLCVHCGEMTSGHDLAILAGDGSQHRWVHAACHRPFLEARRARAEATIRSALSAAALP